MDLQRLDDKELLCLVRANAPDAFAELSRRYLWLLRMQAERFSGPAAPEREDLLQEGLMGLYTAALSYEEARGAAFHTYAGICVLNRMADAARKHSSSRNRLLNESLSLDSEAAAQLAAETGPEDLLELREQVRSLLARLDEALSPLEKKALGLFLTGSSRSEAAACLGVSLKAYDNAIFRVRRKLKKH